MAHSPLVYYNDTVTMKLHLETYCTLTFHQGDYKRLQHTMIELQNDYKEIIEAICLLPFTPNHKSRRQLVWFICLTFISLLCHIFDFDFLFDFFCFFLFCFWIVWKWTSSSYPWKEGNVTFLYVICDLFTCHYAKFLIWIIVDSYASSQPFPWLTLWHHYYDSSMTSSYVIIISSWHHCLDSFLMFIFGIVCMFSFIGYFSSIKRLK